MWNTKTFGHYLVTRFYYKAPVERQSLNFQFLMGYCCSGAKSCPIIFDPMDWMQHTRLPCPSLSPRVCSNSWPLSWWCHPTISSSVVPFSSFIQSFQASESFPRSQLFTSGGQSIGVPALASVLPMNTQDWSPLLLHNKLYTEGFAGSSACKESACNVGDPGSIPGSGRSSGERMGYPGQCSWLPWWLRW